MNCKSVFIGNRVRHKYFKLIDLKLIDFKVDQSSLPLSMDETIEVCVGEIIAYLPFMQQDDDDLFFSIGKVVEVEPSRDIVIVNKLNCTTICWREALSPDPELHVRYIETCRLCADRASFRLHAVPLVNVVMSPIILEGEQQNELGLNTREKLAYYLGVPNDEEPDDEEPDDDAPPGYITCHRPPRPTFMLGSLSDRFALYNAVPATFLHHMDESCPRLASDNGSTTTLILLS